ncbi:MAG: CRTAC1 family protein [Acidobacteriota bacterium]
MKSRSGKPVGVNVAEASKKTDPLATLTWSDLGSWAVGLVVALLLASSMRAQSGLRVAFTDITDSARISFKHAASPTAQKYLLETMGSGVAVFDSNNDGWLDVFFVNGAQLDDPMPVGKDPEKTDKKYWNRLYQNNRDGTFSDVTEKAGLAGQGYGMGAAVGDFDNDGLADLYVTNYERNLLYRNDGDGTFTDVTRKAGVRGAGWSVSAGWLDYDHDGRLDLFVCRYMTWDFSKNIFCGEQRPGYRAYCHPNSFKGVSDILYRNNGDGTFTDVSQKSGIAAATSGGKALGVAFADYDGDGWTDIFVANDSIRQTLLRNRGDGTFEDATLGASVGYDENGKTFAGMGVDFSDYDNDGWPDVLVTTLSNETYALFRNSGDGAFDYATGVTGMGQATSPYSGWGVKFLDYDHDGWKDLIVAQGHVLDTIQLTSSHLRYQQKPIVLRNGGGKQFVDVSATLGAAFGQAWSGRGLAAGDLDNDGDLDLVVSNSNQRAYVLRNDGGNAAGNWILIKLVGTRSNRDGIGASIKLTGSSGPAQYTTVTSAGSYASSSDPKAHFGLGKDATVKAIEITWPSGLVQRLEDVKSNQILTVREPVASR